MLFHYFSLFFTSFHCFSLVSTVFHYFSSIYRRNHRFFIDFFFRSEAPPNLSARAKKNSEGAPGFAERENPRPETRAGENGGQGARTPALQRLHRTVCFARLLRTSRKTGRTYTLRKRNGEGSEGEPRREKGPEGGQLVYNATATPQPPRGAGGAPEA